MIPNVNPRQMKQMMQRMGIQQEDIDAEQVIIVCSDRKIIIDNPSVQRVNMMGQKSYQISGEENIVEVSGDEDSQTIGEVSADVEITDDDISTVAAQAQVSEGDARKALEETGGNIAEAILSLTVENQE